MHLRQNKRLNIKDTVKEFKCFAVPGTAVQLESRQAAWHSHYAGQHGTYICNVFVLPRS